ncbi:MAG: hypothetical protein JO061_01105 [Acidobacteriaceae bacterium]|nr:hypothetical protein [Acidobacteriaceae bacterium]
MRIACSIVQNVIRLLGVVLLVVGFLFWTRHALELIPFHRALGIVLVVLLWFLSGLGFAARLKPGLVIAGFCWGLLTLYFGLIMQQLLPGRAHEVIRVAHFLIGLGAIGVAEAIAGRTRRTLAALPRA